MTLHRKTYDVTFGSLLHGMSKHPFITSVIVAFSALAIVFIYGIYSGSRHGLMLPFFLHAMTVLSTFAPGVLLRFFLYRRWLEKPVIGISGGMSFFVTLVETTIFLVVMSNGISAYQDTGTAFLFAIAMIIFGTIANLVFLIWALVVKYREKQEQGFAIQAEYIVHDRKRGVDDFYNPINYR